ncbi:MAG: squalene/phytoene synthase family protein, partial [Gemmatimonadota bacterium]|nr:squalene/phytoene synthase family protein [Gemmatimonadota bacterium]MDQ8173481.1 squalene/phytoene synthase family protein [Gemmatimonadota bacterium]
MTLPTAVSAALAQRDAARFCVAILPAVSRTFALGIKALPGALGQAVLDAYLLCRIADTVEDAPSVDPQVKAALFDDFLAAFTDRVALDRFVAGVQPLTGNEAHLALTHHADLVFAHFAGLPVKTRAVVQKWVAEMAVGMRKFVLLYPDGIRIQTIE